MSRLRHGVDYIVVDGEPVYAWEVLDDEATEDDGLTDCLTIDSWNPDPWTHDAIIAQLIIAFSDEAQSAEAPF